MLNLKKNFLIAIVLLASCSAPRVQDKPAEPPVSVHPLTMATIYNYYAEEYRALAYQAFNIARLRVDNMLATGMQADKAAIVVDIDETLIDNSPAEAILIEKDSTYPFMWVEWCELEAGRAVPGAVEFLQYADEKGFEVFYVSNRKDATVRVPTMNNLNKLGFHQVDDTHVMLRQARGELNPDPSDKQGRREQIMEQGYEIVMLIGDNLGDFYTDLMGFEARTEQVDGFRDQFGDRFIILPNAMYGNWQKSLDMWDSEAMDSLIFNMTKVLKTESPNE